MTAHIFITGGVVSSLGKGITAASLAYLLKEHGYRVAIQKLDPYLNVDPGTMNPFQHGEVFVTDDGAETDLDLGHYERFAGVTCTKASNYTSGRIYASVIERERCGEYLGATVQIIPHVTNEIKDAMRALHTPETDIAITEIGGTVGDIESQPFLEAARQFVFEAGRGRTAFIHLTPVLYLSAAGELKTKPSQRSVAELRSIGITPDVLICRTEVPMSESHFEKLALFCNVKRELVIEELDVKSSVYEVPLELARQQLDTHVLRLLNLRPRTVALDAYRAWLEGALNPVASCTIGLVGKYSTLRDAYKSIYEALEHAGIAQRAKVNVIPVDAEEFERGDAAHILAGLDGVLVPGGFGARGVTGKIRAIEHARIRNIPFLGICLGMQCAVIEFARNVLGLAEADSGEFAPETPHPVIDLMENQKAFINVRKGGTMRLGAYDCVLAPESHSARLYGGAARVSERHRHRYEVNPTYRDAMTAAGLIVAGASPDGNLVEIVELRDHPYFVACQFHPEFKSRPRAPHPLFAGFVEAALAHKGGDHA